MNIKRKRIVHGVLVAIGTTLGQHSFSQEVLPLEEVIVTAQKREQRLEEVPIAIQAFGQQKLEEASARDLSEVITFVPGASENGSLSIGAREYQIRGINQGLGDSTVGYYVDDSAFFIYGYTAAPLGRSFDMQRVEVLRGPQSTLYGNGSMGGTVRYITNDPDSTEWQFAAKAGYADSDRANSSGYLDAALNIPLIQDHLALRLVASKENVGGWHNIPAENKENTNDGEISSYRARLLWEPTDRLSLNLLYSLNNSEQDGGMLLASLEGSVANGRSGDYNDIENELFSVTFEYDFDFASLNSTTTKIDAQNDAEVTFEFPLDPSGVLRAGELLDGDAVNNETRLVSLGDGPIQWMAGFFYSDTEFTNDQYTSSPLLPPSTQVFKSESLSVFGEASLELMDGKLIPLVGIRYFEDDRETESTAFGGWSDKDTFDSVNPRFNLTYNPTLDSMYYLNIAKGFRSGGFNNPIVCDLAVSSGLPCERSVDSDELWSYEIGTKLTLADNQVVLDLALYYQDWKDVRQGIATAGFFNDYQAGDGKIPGIDIGLTYNPASVSGLSFTMAANWNDAHWDSIDPAILETGAVPKEEGDRLPLVPEWTANITASYNWEITSGWSGTAFVAYTHLEPQQGIFASDIEGDERDLLRARVGAEINELGLGVYLFGKNLLDEDGAIYTQDPSGGGLLAYTQDQPRQIGIELTYNL